MILLIDAIAIILVYFIMPSVQNFPPLSEDFAFQDVVQPVTHVQQYTIVYLIGISIHLFTFKFLMKKIYAYLNKYYRKEKITYQEIREVRKDITSDTKAEEKLDEWIQDIEDRNL